MAECPIFAFPFKQSQKTQRAHDIATFNIYFLFREVLRDVAHRGANLQEKDLVVELGPWLDPLVHPDLGVPLLGCLSGA